MTSATAKKTVLLIEPGSSLKKDILLQLAGLCNLVIATNAETTWIKDAIPASNLLITDPYCFNKLYYDVVSYTCINNLQFNAAITFYEHAVMQTSMLAAALGLPHTPFETVFNSSINKINMRNTLNKCGLSKIKFLSSNRLDLQSDIHKFPKPCVIKPLFGSDSYGVRKIKDDSEIPAYIDQLAKELVVDKERSFLYKSDVLIMEEYVEGKLLSIDGIIVDKNILCFDPIEVFSSPEPYFVQYENRFPSSLNSTQIDNVKNYVISCLQALKFNNTGYHAEVKFKDDNEIEIIEIAARAPGGQLINAHKIINGFDFASQTLDLYLGMKIDLKRISRKDECALIQKGVFPQNPGVLKKLDGIERISSIQELNRFMQLAKVGDMVKNYPDDYPSPIYFYELVGKDIAALNNISQKIESDIMISVS